MTDADGEPLDGSLNYRLHLPAGIPARDFWSIVIYDPQTRSELQTGQRYPSLNNARDQLQYNDDGSIDLYFGPEAPAEGSSNWIQSVPGKSWFTLIRLYGAAGKLVRQDLAPRGFRAHHHDSRALKEQSLMTHGASSEKLSYPSTS